MKILTPGVVFAAKMEKSDVLAVTAIFIATNAGTKGMEMVLDRREGTEQYNITGKDLLPPRHELYLYTRGTGALVSLNSGDTLLPIIISQPQHVRPTIYRVVSNGPA